MIVANIICFEIVVMSILNLNFCFKLNILKIFLIKTLAKKHHFKLLNRKKKKLYNKNHGVVYLQQIDCGTTSHSSFKCNFSVIKYQFVHRRFIFYIPYFLTQFPTPFSSNFGWKMGWEIECWVQQSQSVNSRDVIF